MASTCAFELLQHCYKLTLVYPEASILLCFGPLADVSLKSYSPQQGSFGTRGLGEQGIDALECVKLIPLCMLAG